MTSGTGPRHIAFHPNQKVFYVFGELSNTVTTYLWEDGKATENQVVNTIPSDYTENSIGADIHLDSQGKYLYCSNRGYNSLALFKVEENLTLTFVSHLMLDQFNIKWTRNFCLIDDEWILIAGQHSNNIGVFKNNQNETVTYVSSVEVPSPTCVIQV